jgi:uncharacterized protein
MPLDRKMIAYPKFDVHTHIGLGTDPVARGYVESYLEDSRRVGIEKLLISRPISGASNIVASPETVTKANDMVMELVNKYPGVIYGYAYLHAGQVDFSLKEMERCMACPGMVGIKLYNQYLFDDPVVIGLVREAARKGAYILLHQGKSIESGIRTTQPNISDGTHIAHLANAVPDARIIVGHIGGGGDWEWCAKSLRDAPTVYLDTSGSVHDAGMIELAIRELGVARLLFATDMSIDQGIGKILGARITDADRRAIFSDNARTFFGEVLA